MHVIILPLLRNQSCSPECMTSRQASYLHSQCSNIILLQKYKEYKKTHLCMVYCGIVHQKISLVNHYVQ